MQYDRLLQMKTASCKFYHFVCMLHEIVNVFTFTYNSRTNRQIKQYNQILTALLHCLECQQNFYAYASTLVYAYNSQVYCFTNARLLDLVLNWKISDFSLKSRNLQCCLEKILPLPNSVLEF